MRIRKISEKSITYFCNAAGDCFIWNEDKTETTFVDLDASSNLTDERIPAPLRAVFNAAWNEGYGYPCYIMTVDGKPYLALIAEFGDTTYSGADSEYYRAEALKEDVLAAAKTLDKFLTNGTRGIKIFFPEDTSTPFCQWEVVVALDAKTIIKNPSLATEVAKAMDSCFKEVE